jgi:hypothetical protein
MKTLAAVALASLLLTPSHAADDQTPLAAVQRLFAAMSAHDANAARALFLPEAMLFSVRPDGSSNAVPQERWVERLGTAKDAWLERIWEPKQFEHGTVAMVWAEFDFHLNGKFSHCGIDSFTLLKTSSGWKIAAVADTHETSTCTPSPLGPPAK